jgi:membrane-associated phospholipid phosphatase
MMARMRMPTRERFFADPLRAVWVGCAFLACVALMAVFVPAEPLALERSWAEAMRDLQTPVLTDIALVLNALGRGLGRVLSLAAVAVVLVLARRWLAVVAFAIAETLAPLASSLLKALVDRARPPGALVHPAGASFPSGHATYAGATCVALVLLFTTPGPGRRPWWALAVLGIVAMAWSRTYLQVHWLSDVVAGSLLGVGVTLVVFGLAQRWKRISLVRHR